MTLSNAFESLKNVTNLYTSVLRLLKNSKFNLKVEKSIPFNFDYVVSYW